MLCPHWGYVFKGKITYRFADHEEIFEAGDAFYVPEGHSRSSRKEPSSPSSARALDLQTVTDVMMKNAQALGMA